MGILILMIYLNVVKIGESNISRGDWRFSRGLLLVHGGFLALSLLALWYRFNSWRLPSFSLLGLLKKTQD
jgi:lipopolysaccharide export LptBFGC system permease protein LptF